MARMIPVDILYEQMYLKFGYDDNRYYELKDFVDNLPKAEAIPVNYILDYLKEHDAVCQNNLATMIKNYNKTVDERNRVAVRDYD